MAAVKYVCVVGPTAGGKTQAAAAIARRFSVPVVVADARKIYREMNVGVNKPPKNSEILYYGIDLVSVNETFSAGRFARYVKSLEPEWSRYPFVVMAGGTGMYVKAATEGLDDLPEVPEEIRRCVRQTADERGWQSLLPEIERHDPERYAALDKNNPARVLRAAELIRSLGGPVSPRLVGAAVPSPTLTLGIFPPRHELHRLIETRTKKMFATGLWDEAAALYPLRKPELPAFRTIGYAECFGFWDGKHPDRAAAENAVVVHTRQYAKRQYTWWNKGGFHRFESFDENAAAERIVQFLECA